MAKRKAKLIVTWKDNRLIWIVSCNGQSKVYTVKKAARDAKAAIALAEKGE